MNFNSKLFLSTFILIFLAELGDKTQLAAMAKSIEGRFTVFVAASLALVCSTLIAVLFGDTLTRFVPERYLQIASGVLFLIFGALMLHNVFFGKAVTAQVSPTRGAFERFITKTAMAFEEAAEADYRRLAAATDKQAVRRVLLILADEEKAHQHRLQTAQEEHGNDTVFAMETEATLPQLRELLHDVAENDAKPFVDHAIEHELATARFYEGLARHARIPGLRNTLQTLAAEERHHAEMLQSLEAYLG
jgi:rubrerythrin